ncbi:MAG: methylmalonyl-CoA epimerase [Candidatus Dadabacteria bacterium]|nr:MAG: methylmalonyl-CoA epimerase [Candidatus Dadabacteria bacterium]
MIKNVDHIGIVVRSIADVLPVYQTMFELEYLGEEVVPDGTVKAAFLKAPDGPTKLELIEPIDNPGVERFIEKRGGGLHHICFLTDDIDRELAELADKGAQLIDKQARPGALGKRVAFLHPKTTQGVLVELAEKPK